MTKQLEPRKRRDRDAPVAAPSVDDALAFRAAVRDVKLLSQTPVPEGLVRKNVRVRRRKKVSLEDSIQNMDSIENMPLVASMPLSEHGQSISEATIAGMDPLSFQRAGVRTQVVRRLRRGLFPIEDELDLHGMSQTAARDHLAAFLSYSREAGRRCVRIIHGKGYRSGTRGPILKIAVDLWLRRHLDVMAFTSARAIDGGTGAVYVLLRA